MAQVITVETKMNVFRDLKFSISAWRAECGGRRNYRDDKENSNRLTFEKPLSNTPTSSLPVIAHVASSTCSCVTLSEMLYTTTSHSSRRSRSSSRVGDYQKRLYTQIHIVCKLSSSRGRPITSKTYIIYLKKSKSIHYAEWLLHRILFAYWIIINAFTCRQHFTGVFS